MNVMNVAAWIAFVVAALLEVVSDAGVRHGLRGRSAAWIMAGCAGLAIYGLVVNSVKWDFSRLLGVYVGFFATVSVLFGRFVFGENIPATTWFGLALIIVGGLIIQFGR
jgi:drug/metabolite transporter superfamily protein YnfA